MPERLIPNPPCPRCESHGTQRVKRTGFIQSVILPMLKRYPWHCSICGATFTSADRGKLKRKRSGQGEVHLPPVG